jgi:PHS family inorganic phosphate transporter-like MFS transporter
MKALTPESFSSTSIPTQQYSLSPRRFFRHVFVGQLTACLAAIGKLGAILSALLFNYLSGPKVIGLPNVLWIFFGCKVLGAIRTWFLIPETMGKDADVVDFQEWQEGGNTVHVAADHDN